MTQKTDQSHKKNWGAQIVHGVARKQDLGNTNTPMDLARAIVRRFLQDELKRQAREPGRWLEPAVGAGNFYMAVLEAAAEHGIDPWSMAQRFDALDIDADAIAALKRRLREGYGWTERQVDALPIACMSLADCPGKHAYRVVLTNPPYLAPKNWSNDAAERKAMLDRWQAVVPGLSPKSDLFLYFFRWCHAHLEPGGASLFLCSDGWLDSDYGRALREDFLGDRLTLETVHAWPWAALFRDDTCPIVTVVRRTETRSRKGPTALVIDDGSPLQAGERPVYAAGARAQTQQTVLLTPDDLQGWLGEGVLNRRARLVAGPWLHAQMEQVLERHAPRLAPFGDLAQVTGFSWSMNQIEQAGMLVAQPGATGKKGHEREAAPNTQRWNRALPVFFQKQARVGKPVDYRQARTTGTLGCRVVLGNDPLSEQIRKTGARAGGAWVSLAIDRFPLAFFQADAPARPWIGVSKYAHASLKASGQAGKSRIADEQHGPLLCALLTSTLSILAMERRLKEGTRKTLRTHEKGYAKEISRGALADLPVPDWRQWDDRTLAAVLALQTQRSAKNLHRLDAAVADPSWIALDNAIGAACGIKPNEMERLRLVALAAYWRRMRHVLAYGPAIAAAKRASA